MESINIGKASVEDSEILYRIGSETPEIKVSDQLPFVGPEEFRSYITNPEGIFLIAESEGDIAGFVYGDVESEKKFDNKKWACLVYIIVRPEFREKGVAQRLFNEFMKEVKQRGATHLYSWANAEGSPVVTFFEKQGLRAGHLYRWMDMEINFD